MKPKLFQFLALLLGAFSLNACSTSETSKAEKITVDANALKSDYDVSSLVDSIDIIKLQEVSGSFIGEAYKICKTDNHYIIFDKVNARRIVVYDNSGKFVKNVADVGSGKHDVVQINDFWINDNQLEIYDFAQKKIFVYDKDFNFLKVIKAKESLIFNSLLRLPKSSSFVGFKGYTSFNPPVNREFYKVAMLDSALVLRNADLTYDPKINNAWITAPRAPFSVIRDSVRFAQNFDHFIYNVTKDGLSKRYDLVYTQNPLPEDFESSIVTEHLPVFKEKIPDFPRINSFMKGYTGYNGSWYETDNYILFESFDKTNSSFFTIYDKSAKRVVSNAKVFKETARFKMMLPPFIATEPQQNSFVAVYPGFIIKTLLLKNSPLMRTIEGNLEANYIVNVKFNGARKTTKRPLLSQQF